MANSITIQPASGTLQSAYRPIYFRFLADISTDPCPIAFCDIYIDGVYYRSISKTRPEVTVPNISASFDFDIQDTAQEFLQKHIAPNGLKDIYEAINVMAAISCKFRTTYINNDGFVDSIYTVPIQGTDSTAPVSGTGITSNTFYIANTTMASKASTSLQDHLNAYKQGVWSTDAFPLTHRPELTLGRNVSDYYPMLVKSSVIPACIRMKYRYKDSNVVESDYSCGACVGASVPGINLTDPVEGYAWMEQWTIYGDAPFTLENVIAPDWVTIEIVELTPGSWIVRLSGVADDPGPDQTIAFDIVNCSGDDRYSFSQQVDVLPVGSRNFKGANGSTTDTGYVIDDVNPSSFYTLNVGSFPSPFGTAFGGSHVAGNVALSVDISGTLIGPHNPFIRLYVNPTVFGPPMIEEIEITGPGTYTFAPYNFLLGDRVTILLDF